MVRLVLALVIVGGRRLRHVEFLRGDPMIERFTGLRRSADGSDHEPLAEVASARSSVEMLRQVNAAVVVEPLSGYLAAGP